MIKKGTYVPALIKAKLYVRLASKKYGTRHPSYARALQLQAKVYRYLKRPVDARKFELRAASILKNHRNFKKKRAGDINAARSTAATKRRAIENRLRDRRQKRVARLQRERAAKKTRTPVQRQPLTKQRPKKRVKRPVIARKKARPAPGRGPTQVQRHTAKPKAAPRRNKTASLPSQSRRTLKTTRQKAAPRPGMRARNRERAAPTTMMRQSGGAPRSGAVSKSTAPPPAIVAPAPPIGTPRSTDASPSAGSPSADDDARFDLFAKDENKGTPSAAPAPATENKNHTIVKVYYATDRQRTNSKQLASIYGGQPADPIRISYGICEVSIPKGHKPGVLEAPSIYRFEFKEDPDKHVVLLNIHPQEKKSYFRNLKNVIAQSKGENAFIFIHGYNVTFSDAARRTAQISYDLGFDGAPVFYSWPSTGELSGYPADEDNILWAQENVKQFLRDFVEQTDAKNIYLVAHSMGSRALTGAVASLIAEAPKFKKRFKEIILAAPDISARIFRDHIAPKMLEASNNVTLYVSADDKALLASRNFHANPRAGEAGENIIIFKGIDTIDATGIDASLLAHSYFAEAKSIISDILAILKGKPPSGRKTLKPVQTTRGTYWAFTK